MIDIKFHPTFEIYNYSLVINQYDTVKYLRNKILEDFPKLKDYKLQVIHLKNCMVLKQNVIIKNYFGSKSIQIGIVPKSLCARSYVPGVMELVTKRMQNNQIFEQFAMGQKMNKKILEIIFEEINIICQQYFKEGKNTDCESDSNSDVDIKMKYWKYSSSYYWNESQQFSQQKKKLKSQKTIHKCIDFTYNPPAVISQQFKEQEKDQPQILYETSKITQTTKTIQINTNETLCLTQSHLNDQTTNKNIIIPNKAPSSSHPENLIKTTPRPQNKKIYEFEGISRKQRWSRIF